MKKLIIVLLFLTLVFYLLKIFDKKFEDMNSKDYIEIDGIMIKWNETLDISYLWENSMWWYPNWRTEIDWYWNIYYVIDNLENNEKDVFDDYVIQHENNNGIDYTIVDSTR